MTSQTTLLALTVLCFSAGVICTGLALDRLECAARQETASACTTFYWNETTSECVNFALRECALQRSALARCQARLFAAYYGLVEYDNCHPVVADLATDVCTYNCSIAEFVDNTGAFRYELLGADDAWCVPRTECRPPSSVNTAQNPSTDEPGHSSGDDSAAVSPVLLAAVVASGIAALAICMACVLYVRLRRNDEHV